MIALIVASGCTSSSPPPAAPAPNAEPTRGALLDVPLPDMSRLDASVQTQVRDRHAAVMQKRDDPQAGDEELGLAYGELGMLLHAAEYLDAAEPAYRNARALQRSELRWPYYLAHLYKTEGDNGKAIDAFTRVLELRPDHAPTLIWLGRMHLEQGQPEVAQPLFERAAAIPPRSVAAVAGLGQTALAKRDFGRAAQLLEEALALDPRMASLHSPLAIAYRGLGDTARAEQHIPLWRNTAIGVSDPLIDALEASVESGLAYELQGVDALDARDFKTAAALFRKGVELTGPDTAIGRSLRHKLGTALALSGDVSAGTELFEEVTRSAPADGFDEPTAKAHYSLGVLAAGSGRTQEAIRHLMAAVRYSPTYVEARLALGDALRAAGRVEAALPHYAEAVRMSPATAADARFGYALGLIRLRRWVEARDWLDEGVRAHPDRPELRIALARVLAASPDARARDGLRAATIVKALMNVVQNTEVGETMAMALAEMGQYGEAAAVQRGVIDAARRAGLPAPTVRQMNANLRLYEQNRPCRTPWPAEHPVPLAGPAVG